MSAFLVTLFVMACAACLTTIIVGGAFMLGDWIYREDDE